MWANGVVVGQLSIRKLCSGNRRPPNFCLCNIMASVFPVCIVNHINSWELRKFVLIVDYLKGHG